VFEFAWPYGMVSGVMVRGQKIKKSGAAAARAYKERLELSEPSGCR
jgi:hypothetical protein